MLFGAAFFAIPGIGPVLVAGPLVAWIIGALEGAVVVGGLSALGAGLYSIGIPKDSVVKYELALKSDKFLILAHGTADEVAKARDIMQTTHAVEVALHEAKREQLAEGSGR
jgi:hypothetical protein